MRSNSRTIVAAVALLGVWAFSASVSAAEIYLDVMFDTQKTSNLVYGFGATENGDIPLELDIYEPIGPGAPAVSPLIVVIHGGGFQGGSKTNNRSLEQAAELGGAGYRVASINYRLMRDDPIPIPGPTDDWTEPTTFDENLPTVNPAIADSVLAVEWLVDNATNYGIDPSRIGVVGFSAGAIIGLHVGYLEWGLDAHVAAVVDMWGGLYGLHTEVDRYDPALMMIHGENDHLVPFGLGESLVASAEAVDLALSDFLLSGVGHNIDMEMIVEGKSLLQHSRDFLNENLVLAPHPLFGDGNGDFFVDAADYTIWADNFALHPGDATRANGDFSSDGFVDAGDYSVWADTFTGTPPTAPGTPTPEPASALLLALGALGIVPRFRRRSLAHG